MGQVERTTKLELDLGSREQGGANSEKRGYLQATKSILDSARAFYLTFFLAHPEKLLEKVQVINQQTGEVREAPISADKLLTWAEYQTVATREHPHPHPDWNFSACFPDCPWEYRRSVIKDCIGKARGYLSAKATQAGLPERRRASRARPPHAIIPPSTKVPARSNSRV